MHVVTTRRLAAALAASLVLVAGIAASAGHPSTASAAQSARPTALSARTHLTVQGRTTMAGYSRDQFGSAWEDVDQNGCDTRDDILRRDLRRVVSRAGTNGCVVVSGVLADPYTATSITYVRGRSRVDIDHVVSLGDAWRTGAARWAASKRLALANDPLNLLAVSASANRQKGDDDAAAWLPANKAYRCVYVARQLAVKLKYALWATSAERGAMQRVLTNCPTLRLPAAGSRPVNLDHHARSGPATRVAADQHPDARHDDQHHADERPHSAASHHDADTSGVLRHARVYPELRQWPRNHRSVQRRPVESVGRHPGGVLRPRRREAVALSLPAEHRSRRGARQRAASEVDPHHNAS